MKVNIETALYNPKAHIDVQQEIHYENDMMALALDINLNEVPSGSLHGSRQHTHSLFDLIVFCCQMFEARDVRNDQYLIQKQYLVPGDLQVRAQLSTGYLLLAMFSKQEFEENFSLICRTAIAINNGHLSLEEALATDMDFEKLAQQLSELNAKMGTFKTGKAKRRKHECVVGSISSTFELDNMIERYHFYLFEEEEESKTWQTSFPQDMYGSDLNQAWLYRAHLLSPEYTFRKSCRMTNMYTNMLHLADLISPGEFASYPPKLSALEAISLKLQDSDIVVKLFQSYLKSCQWHVVYSEKKAGTGWVLNLQDQVAWKVEEAHKLDLTFFHIHRFYSLSAGDQVTMQGMQMISQIAPFAELDTYTKHVLHETVGQLCSSDRDENVAGDTSPNNRFACLYPAMSSLKFLYSNFAKVLKMNGQVSQCYQNPHFGKFFSSVYNDIMKGNMFVMSEARSIQYKQVPKMLTYFNHGCLNSTCEGQSGEHLLFSARMIQDVEPTQDILANELLLMASLCGICHLSTEFFLCLFSNILSFTTKCEKPIVVLDGPTGAGKSYMTHCNQAIVTGIEEIQNSYACVEEHYTTTKSHTVSLINPYGSVLGQRLIEEWQSGSGSSNPFMDNVSLESVTLKNVYDHGMSSSQRCKTVKQTNKEEKIVRSVEFALNDRATIILANGFSVCSSIEERCLVYHIPDLTTKVGMTPYNQLQAMLNHYKIPHFFAMVRYHITEQYNRDALGLSLKYVDQQESLDMREIELTFSRLEQVLDQMGLSHRTILTHRKKLQIIKFAELLAHWRAVIEVYGSIHQDCKVKPPHEKQTFEDYNCYLAKCMTNHLGSLSADEKDKRIAERVVVDPSDILSAMTLVVQFDKSDKRLLRVLCCHLTQPTCFEQVEPWGQNYFVIENITVRRICDELKKQSLPILKEFLSRSLAVLEDTMMKNNVPYIIRRFDRTGVNHHRDKDMQQFCLMVNASQAATMYVQENNESVKKILHCLTNHLKSVTVEGTVCNWAMISGGPKKLKVGYVKLSLPKSLMRMCGYLYHLPVEPRPVRSCIGKPSTSDEEHCEVEVSVDFGWSRLRILQALLVQHIIESQESETNFLADHMGYVSLSVEKTEVFSFATNINVKSLTKNADTSSLLKINKDGSLSAHIAIFSDIYKQKGIDLIRKQVIETVLRSGQHAKGNYFTISRQIRQVFSQMEDMLKTTASRNMFGNAPLFQITNNKLKCHIALLASIAGSCGVTEEEENVGQTLVEKALCKDMTDQSSIMIFDREKVYKTQNLVDAISFIDVQEAMKKHHSGSIPEHLNNKAYNKCYNWYSSMCPTSNRCKDSFLTQIQNLNACSKNGKDTYHPCHRLRKLALKHLLKTNKITTSKEFLAKFEEELQESIECKYFFSNALNIFYVHNT